MATESTVNAASALMGAITSPAKIVLVGFIVVVAMGKVTVTLSEFLLVGAGCFVAQIVHDDWLRIVLNRCAEKWPKKA
jgi:hypothetical protein